MQKTKVRKSIDREISAAYKLHFDYVQVPIRELTKICEEARALIASGYTANDALKKIRTEKYA